MICDTCKVEIQPNYDKISDWDHVICNGCQLSETPWDDRSDVYARYLNEARVYFFNPTPENATALESARDDALFEVVHKSGKFIAESGRRFIERTYADQREWLIVWDHQRRYNASVLLETELQFVASVFGTLVPEHILRDGARLRVASRRVIRKEAAEWVVY